MARRSFIIPLTKSKSITLMGGPYRERPTDKFGVKMAVEITAHCDVDIPTHDFSTPKIEDVDAGLIDTLKALRALLPVYVGCMGGIGRTGLFLAVLAKAFNCKADMSNPLNSGLSAPVAYVRRNYLPHAVETNDQQMWIDEYDIPFKAKLLVWEIKLRALFIKNYYAN